jgi:DNA polymerase-4
MHVPGEIPTNIVHVDMDAFFASVEVLRHPELVNKPVIVGAEGPRGVVAAASYAARAYGIGSAMPSVRARRLCPSAVFLPGDLAHYSEVSERIMDIFASVTPLVEPLSLDEAFMDVGGAQRLLGDPVAIANRLRNEILAQEDLHCSVGVARTKFLAKLASETAKPTPSRDGPIPGVGVVHITADAEREFLEPLDVSALWGVGKVTGERLARLGVTTVGDLGRFDVDALCSAVGNAVGRHLHDLALGRDDRRVVANREVKSISLEQTYPSDLHDVSRIEAELVRMSDGVAARLRRAKRFARTVSVKVRLGDFTTLTRSLTPSGPTDSGSDITAISRELFASVPLGGQGVRLLGVAGSGLVKEAPQQLQFEDSGPSSNQNQNRVRDELLDEIRTRFGPDAIAPAGAMVGSTVSVARRGAQQWGPEKPPESDAAK